MSEQVKIFDNPEFGQVRTIEQENKVWFGATDVATALGYSNPRDAIVRHCKSAGVVNHDVGVQTGLKSDGSPSIQNITMKFINEGNVYRLIANSQLPQAEKFNIVGEGEIAITKSGKKMSKWYYDAISLPKEERQKLRSKTFQGIADAMADQWG